MKTFVTATGLAVGVSAGVLPRSDECCFQLSASGDGVSGTVGQLDDGQNRVGGGLGSATYCINNGMITDKSGRGCILTGPTTQFQCDMGASPAGGFSVHDGELQHDGDSTFYACPADEGEYNLYTEKLDDMPKCVEVWLSTGGKCGNNGGNGGTSAAGGSSTAGGGGQTCPPAQTVTKTEQSKASTVYKTETKVQPTTEYKPTTIHETKTEQNTKVKPTTVYSIKTVEETETATKPTTVYQTKTEQQTVTAETPTTVYQTKTEEETETATKPTTVYQTKTEQQTVTAQTPTTVYQTKTVEETETATKPTTVYKTEQQTVTAQTPTTVYKTKTEEETETATKPTTVYKTEQQTVTAQTPTTVYQTKTVEETETAKKPVTQYVTKTVEGAGGKPTETKPASTGEGSACPTNLNGNYEYPHLIVPVNEDKPEKSYGTSYNGKMDKSTSSIFNFDIPQSYEGQTCSLVFLFPKKSDLETSDFTFNGQGSISIDHLSSPAKQSTSWHSAPQVDSHYGDISPQPGNSYVVHTGDCAAGTTQSYELSAANGLSLEYFQDYNPSPIGLYITTC